MTLICVDCGKEINGHDYYMVHDHVWMQTGLSRHGGMLCIEHLEARLGRHITVDDLSNAPINWMTGIIPFLILRADGLISYVI